MDKIRLLHFADLHVGMENYGRLDPATGVNDRVLDFLHRFDELIDYGLEREVDLVIFAGDAFKTRNPNPTYQRAFARRVKRLADAGVPIVLLVGNHDLPTMVQRASSVDIFRTLEVPNVVVGWEEKVHTIETRRGPMQVATVPYPVRQRLLAHDDYRGLSIRELDDKLQGIVAEIIQAMARQIDPDIPAVLAAHLSVSGAVFGSERSVMIGRDAVVLKSVLADPAWDYVALGHIHLHQSLNGDGYPAVVYAGSPERIDFGEEKQPKGFCWVELARGETTWEFVEVDARPFVTVRADVREAASPLMALQQEIAKHDLTGPATARRARDAAARSGRTRLACRRLLYRRHHPRGRAGCAGTAGRPGPGGDDRRRAPDQVSRDEEYRAREDKDITGTRRKCFCWRS